FSLQGARKAENPENEEKRPKPERHPEIVEHRNEIPEQKETQIQAKRLPDMERCKLIFVFAVHRHCNKTSQNRDIAYDCQFFSLFFHYIDNLSRFRLPYALPFIFTPRNAEFFDFDKMFSSEKTHFASGSKSVKFAFEPSEIVF